MPLPPGLLLNAATGEVFGTPTAAGTSTFTLRVSDSIGTSRDIPEEITILPYVAMSIATIPARITTDVAFSYNPAVVNGLAPYVYTQGGNLPTGLSFTPATGVISGTPTVTNDFSMSATVTDALAQQSVQAVVIQVKPAPTVSGSVPHGTVGKPFTTTFSVSGGHAPVVATLDVGAFPVGTNLAGLVLGGTPTTPETANFTVRVTDDIGASTTTAFSTLIVAAPSLTGILPAALVNGTYSGGYTLSGGEAAFTWSLLSGVLPPGLSINASTGAITGTPSAVGTFTPTIMVVDAQSNVATRSNAIIISPELIFSGAAPDGGIGIAYSFAYTVGGGVPGLVVTLDSGTLPAGLNLSSTGVLSGTPTTTATSSFTIRVTDANGNTKTLADSVQVFDGATLSGTLAATGTTTVAYSSGLSAVGVAPIVWSISAGTLPVGLSMSTSTGVISGTPTTAATSNFTVRIVDAVASEDSRAQSIVVAAFPTLSGTLASATQNAAYSSGLSRSGGHGTGTWSISSGTLPVGLSINAGTGVISGTPTTVQSSAITIAYTDTQANVATKAQTITVSAAIGLAANYAPSGYVGEAYSSSGASVSGGTAPFSFSKIAGLLPPGAVLSASTGAISVNPIATAGVGSFTIRVTDAIAQTASASDSISFFALPSWTQPTLDVSNGTSLAGALTGTLGSGAPYTFAGTLGFGLSLASGGTFTGTANDAGAGAGRARTFTVTSTDSNARAGSGKTLTITFYDAVIATYTGSLKMTRNVAFSQSITATNGKAPLAYAVASGALPTGVSVNSSTGAVSGTPTAVAATYNAAFKATDALGSVGTTASNAFVLANQMALSGTLAEAVVGSVYSIGLSLSGGHSAFTWSISAGALPSGLSINSSTGVISGTPTTAATSNFTVRVVDSSGQSIEAAKSIITYAVPSLSGTPLDGTIGAAYSSGLTASGGKAPLTWSISVGTLPAGLSINSSTGVISGTPTTAATSNFTVRAVDALGSVGTLATSMTVYAAVSLSGTLASATVGAAYSSGLAASGGKAPLVWSISAGALPSGLSINSSTGVISGTPTTAATSNFTVRAVDALGSVGTRATSMTVYAVVSLSGTLFDGTIGSAYSGSLTASGGKSPLVWSISAGALPSGLSINSGTGVISGTPTTAATSNFTVRAVDALGSVGTRATSMTVYAAVSLSGTLASATVGVAYSSGLTASGGKAPLVWSISAGVLPTGLSISSSTGVISGTPTTGGTSNVTVRAVDALSSVATNAQSIVVVAEHSVSAGDINEAVIGISPKASGTSTAAVTGGVGPFTYAWAFVAGGSFIALSGETTATVTATRNGTSIGIDTGTLRCSVTDTGNGNLLKFKDITVTLENSN